MAIYIKSWSLADWEELVKWAKVGANNAMIGEFTEVEEIPPHVDAVPVVRCKDCVHLEILNGSTYYARCRWHGRLFASFGRADTRTWFCADGERRTK